MIIYYFLKRQRMNIELYNGDCLKVMDELIEKGIKVDSIITDPPYGTTACSWDTVIPFTEMWERLNKLIKPNGAIVLFGSQPFTSALVMSNIKMYSHNWIWEKQQGTNILLCNKQPLKNIEDIMVFYNNDKDYIEQHPLKPYFKRILKELKLKASNINDILQHRKAERCFWFKSKHFSLCEQYIYEELVDKLKIKKFDFYKPYKDLKKINDDYKIDRVYNPQMENGSPYKSNK